MTSTIAMQGTAPLSDVGYSTFNETMTAEVAVQLIKNGDRQMCSDVIKQFGEDIPLDVVIAAYDKFGTTMMRRIPKNIFSKAVVLALVHRLGAPILILLDTIEKPEMAKDQEIALLIADAKAKIDNLKKSSSI